ncbi:MAG: flagellar biosynthesis protein FlhA [Calditrichia bacterium]
MSDTGSAWNIRGMDSNSMLAMGVILILAVMILPLPAFLLDMLLVMNITSALVIMFVALYVMRPVDFSVFPGILLILTLFRLSLNIASTRLILGDGYSGEIIEAFGNVVVGGNFVVGGVIFLILVLINFIVITKGATRIAEVSARFTLDAMPGKQMSIDADLNAGLIDDQEAKLRREIISQEADFYGAMDGASKFVRGDAVAGLLITVVNLVGGLLIGVLQMGLPLLEAATQYTLLTIGDGLIAQIPALIISTAAGIVISRASSASNLGTDIQKQITREPKAILVTALILMFLAVMPGMPFLPFFTMALIMGLLGSQVVKAHKQELELAEAPVIEEIPEEKVEERIEEFLHPDAFEIEIGYGLIPMVDTERGGNLLNRITMIRKSFAIEMGVIVPPIRIRDNIQMSANAYCFKVYGVEVASGDVMAEHYMIVNPDPSQGLRGIEMTEPTFGLPALWVNKQEKEQAEMFGNTVVEAEAVIATHLMETLKKNCYKLLDRQEVQRMLEHLKETHSALIEELVPNLVTLGIIQKVLKNLLKESIPIRNLVMILETIADYSVHSKDAEVLTEYVRSSLAETITDLVKNDNDVVVVATLEPQLESHFIQNVKAGKTVAQNLGFMPDQVNNLFKKLGDMIEKAVGMGENPVLLVSPLFRRHMKSFVEPVFPNLTVLSFSELRMDTEIKSIDMVGYPHANENVLG